MKKIIDWIRKYIVWIGFTLVVIGIFFDSKSTTSQVNIDKEQNVNIDKEQNVNIDKEIKSLTKGWNHWEGIGSMQRGYESFTFRPTGTTDFWSVMIVSDSLASIYFNKAGKPKRLSNNSSLVSYKSLRFRIRGVVSPKGSYGHMGSSGHIILIQEISEIEK